MRYVCPKCFQILDSDELHMHKRGCKNKPVEVDEQMAFAIQQLWLKGVVTKYCCAGHLESGFPDGYIVLTKRVQRYAQAVRREYDYYDHILFEYAAGSSYNCFVIRADRDRVESNPQRLLMIQYLFIQFLLDLANSLPDIGREVRPKQHCEKSVMELLAESANMDLTEEQALAWVRDKLRSQIDQEQTLSFSRVKTMFAKTKRAFAKLTSTA